MALPQVYSRDELIEVMDASILYLLLGSIKTMVDAKVGSGVKMAGFIIAACTIDTLAGFYAGADKRNYRKDNKRRFMRFVKKYLKDYDAEPLYVDMRCGLVHSFTDQNEAYIFGRRNAEESATTIALDDFYDHLCSAYEKYKEDIRENDELFAKAKTRFNSLGLVHGTE